MLNKELPECQQMADKDQILFILTIKSKNFVFTLHPTQLTAVEMPKGST